MARTGVTRARGLILTAAIGAVSGQLACGSLLSIDDDPRVPVAEPPGGSPSAEGGVATQAEGGAGVDGGDGGADGGSNDADSDLPFTGACGTNFTDGFEGGMFRGEWTELERPTVNHLQLVTSPVRTGAGAIRFKTVLFSDITSVGRPLTGGCPLLLEAYFRVTPTSGQDNSGLITIERGPESLIRVVLQDTRLRMLEGVTDKAYTADYVRDGWNQVRVEYYGTRGEIQLRLNSDAKRIAIVTPVAPSAIRLGVRGAADGNQGADEVFLDDVTVRH